MAAPSAEESALLAEFERRRKARSLTLPTDDIQVKLALRRCSQPICLFGEDVLDRRERLRNVLSTRPEEEVQALLHGSTTLKLWTTSGWQPLKVLESSGMKVMSVDVSPDGKWVSSSSSDRTFKLWTSE